jgi:hypothetical protein
LSNRKNVPKKFIKVEVEPLGTFNVAWVTELVDGETNDTPNEAGESASKTGALTLLCV